MKKGINHLHQKQFNRGLIFQEIAANERVSRPELARRSGLTKMTLSNIISEFIDKGYVAEDVNAPGSARNVAQPLKLSPDAPKIAGVLIQRGYIAAVLCDYSMKILRSCRVEMSDFSEERLVSAAMDAVAQMLEGVEKVAGIGISSIGPVDVKQGNILNPPDFCGVHDVPIGKYFQQHFRLPVFLGHHQDNMALAEKYYGVGRDYHDFLFYNTSGANLSVITGNELLSNLCGFPCEFGHLSIKYDGPQCHCGNNGCLGGYFDYDAAAGDEEMMQRHLKLMTTVFTGMCNLFNPQAIIIGDDRHLFTDTHLWQFERELNQLIVLHPYRHINVHHAHRIQDLEIASSVVGVITETFKGNLLF